MNYHLDDILIEKIEEYELSSHQHQLIKFLLQQAFPSYPTTKSFFNQLPNFRFLAWQKEQLIGQMGVAHRLITLNGSSYKIFGIIDICVDTAFQSKEIASTFLNQLENIAKSTEVDFLVLISKDHQLYLKNGFQLVENIGKWLIVHNRQTLGVAHRRLDDCLMIKSIQNKRWEEGTVDFLGAIF